jgi:hypothetical protein
VPAHLSPEQLERALELQRKFWTHERIATEIGVHRTTVSRTLAKHNRRSLKRLERQTAAIKAQQLAQLEWLAEQAAEAWEKSLDDEETRKSVEGFVGDKMTDKEEKVIKGQSGNPALLREARGALADARKILGLDAAPPQPEPEFDISQLTEEAERDAATYRPDERPGTPDTPPG